MANSTSHILPYPIRGARFTLPITFRVAAGTPTDPTTPDTEVSTDGGATFADTTEDITTGGTSGAGYLTLTSTETANNLLIVSAKSANCVASLVILYPRILASIGTGTLSAGSAGGGTLGTLLAYDVTGCFIRTTGGTGGASGSFQARKIVTYNTSTGAFTVLPNWETTPSTDTTYEVHLPEGVTLGMLKTLNPTTAGRTLTVDSSGRGLADLDTIKTQALTNAAPITFSPYVGSASQIPTQFFAFWSALITGTAQAGGSSTITLASGASSTNDYYKDGVVRIVSGTGAGQERHITGYVGSTKVATVDDTWATNPDNTSIYQILGHIA